MHDAAQHVVERVLPDVPIRQYVLSPSSEMVGQFAVRGEALSARGRTSMRALRQHSVPSKREAPLRRRGFVQRSTKVLSTSAPSRGRSPIFVGVETRPRRSGRR